MKKVLALMLAMVLAMSFAACGGNESSKKEETPTEVTVSNSNEIELTLDNYSKYLDVNMWASADGNATWNDYYMGYPYIKFGAQVKGISQNFNYNDIKVTGKIKGSYSSFSWSYNELFLDDPVQFEKEIVVECNINGNGGYSCPNSEIIKMESHSYIDNKHIKDEFEVTAISGTVTPA